MKSVVILYHKNIKDIYQKEWIDKCIDSIKNQTYQDFEVYEVNYGGDNYSLCQEYGIENFKFWSEELLNHAEAMNFLFEKSKDFDCIFNVNIDDYYHLDRFQLQVEKIKEGFDITSSSFIVFEGDGSNETILYFRNFSGHDIKEELINRDHNVIAHPVVCYSKKFINENKYLGEDIPNEDFFLWKKTIDNYKYYIHPEYLLNYRIHNKQITSAARK